MRTRVLPGVAAAAALLISGCAGGGAPAPAPPGAAAAAAAAGFPARVADCAGRETAFDGPAARIVTSNAAALEMLLELGAGERLVGTGYPPGRGYLPGALAERGARVPVLGQQGIAKEKLLGSGADLYVDTFGAMSMGGGTGGQPSEQEFAAAGIKHVFLLSTACAAQGKAPRTDLAEVQRDVERLGAVTGTGERARQLTAAMAGKTGRVAAALAALPAERRPSYFFFDVDAGTKQPMAVCNRQVANAVITLAGARNVFADCDASFRPVGWEDVVARDPDWIQLGIRDKGGEEENRRAYEEAEQFLRTFPATRGLTAVREGRFLRIGSEVTTIAGVRNADTVERIARTLHPDLVKVGP
ncbi:ABC transporter substrate-binding protein [Kitasatospora sp. NPDC051853]|uniref:ABC transporter substrate-binding protein n=1 Tax=Kitasatospora sp. NPDC051853 TaxID=3364058 RepID=UPI003792B044